MWGYSSSGSLVVELRKASVESETQTEVTFPPQATGVHPIATPQEVVPVAPGPPPLISVQTTLKTPPPTPSPKTIRRTISMGPSTQTLFPASSKFIMVLSLSFLPLTQYPKGDSEEEYEDQPTPGQSTSRVEISPRLRTFLLSQRMKPLQPLQWQMTFLSQNSLLKRTLPRQKIFLFQNSPLKRNKFDPNQCSPLHQWKRTCPVGGLSNHFTNL